MAYTPYDWDDDLAGGTPITAERLDIIEQGIADAAATADDALPLTGGTLTGPLDLTDTAAGTLKIGTTTVEPLATVTNLADFRSGESGVGGLYVKHVPPGGVANAHAITVNQTGTSGTGGALNVASSSRTTSALQVRGEEDGLGTAKITHVNASGTADGDANAAAISVDLQKGAETGTAAQGLFITSTDGTTGRLMRIRNGSTTDLLTVGPAGDLYVGARALGEHHPHDHGLAAWAYDPAQAINTTVLTSGTVYLIRVPVPRPVSVSTLYWHVGVAASGATAGQNWVGLYTAAGTRLATTGIDAAITTTGVKATTITTQALTPGYYWIGILTNATTPPGLARTTGLAGAGGLVNAGLSAANYRFGTGGTAQTTLPTPITPTSNGQGIPLWAAAGA